MWQDWANTKNLKGVYTIYRLVGLNQDRFISILASRGIALFRIKKKTNSLLTFCVNTKENKKLFTILSNLWYNEENCYIDNNQTLNLGGYKLTRVKDAGVFYPVYYLTKNLGVLIGGLLFITLAIFFNGYLFSVQFVGSGSVLQNEISKQLESKGIKRFSRFASIDLDCLANDILASNSTLTFVDCYKNGNRLNIRLELAVNAPPTIDNGVERLVADCDGVVEQIKLYRGTALVSEGDFVKKGDVLIDGFINANEEQIKVNVLAKVVIVCDSVFEYKAKDSEFEKGAIALAKLDLGDYEIVKTSVQKTSQEDGFTYLVTLSYRKLLYAG